MDRNNIRLAVVGATGAVGKEVLTVLEQRAFPVKELVLLASRKSAGTTMKFRGEDVLVEELNSRSFDGADIAIFSAGSAVSREAALAAKAAGCVAIDNSSAWRMDDDVPLVVPEINGGDIKKHKGIIANPNCTTAITLMALWPLHKAFGVKRIIASSYQAVSGAGAQGVRQLEQELSGYGTGGVYYDVTVDNFVATRVASPSIFMHPIASNVIPQVDVFQPSGYTKEEEKMQNEGRKIMHLPGFKASVTCVRVPVYRAHSVSVCAELERTFCLSDVLSCLDDAPGIRVLDDTENASYPTPLQASGKYECLVGRIRRDSALDNSLSFFVCGDQLLKGAALNAVQIAEHLVA